MIESKIVTGAGGTVTFVGPDAARLYAATALRSALGLLAKGIQPTRGFTLTRALQAASAYTGKKYRRAQIETAREDLRVWCDEMSAALPRERSENV